jgi:hypothetical protein
MPFPNNPSVGDTHVENNTTYKYLGPTNGWYRVSVGPSNDTTYTGGGGGNASATGNAGEIQYTDGTNLAASPDLLWDDVNKDLEIGGDITLDDGGTFTTTVQTVTPTANRTISFPDATGTVALVAGSSGQLLWNNAGVNAGVSTLTYDGSILTTSGRFINSYNATASSPAKTFTGTWFTGGTGTTTKPQVLIEPTGTTSTAWSTSGTGLGVNAASGFTGNLLDLQVNGTSTCRVTSAGLVYLPASGGDSSAIIFGGSAVTSAASYVGIYGFRLRSALDLSWSSGQNLNTLDLRLFRDAANTLAQRNGTDAQAFRVYNTYTDASNYERLSTTWSSNVCYTKPENAGTGSARLYVPVTGSTTVASLPSASTAGAGARAFVTDANATTFLSTVAGGGANKVPVVSDGTNWLIG